ncbi:MAG: hypothetical protein IPM14_18105 [bacterium]|nr:hypothetical protein [bacterium]
MKRIYYFTRFGLIILSSVSCTKEENPIVDPPPQATRSFLRWGFTFPYDISSAAVIMHDKLATDADLISHHFDDGIPWPEALSVQIFTSIL